MQKSMKDAVTDAFWYGAIETALIGFGLNEVVRALKGSDTLSWVFGPIALCLGIWDFMRYRRLKKQYA